MYDIRVTGEGLAPRTIVLTGELDISCSGHLVEVLESVLAATTAQWIVVDLRGTTLIDTNGVRELVDAHGLATRRGRVLIMRYAAGTVADPVRFSGADTTLGRSGE